MEDLSDNRREADRRRLSVDLKFLLDGRHEATGMLLDISETGLALISDMHAKKGDDIVVYPIGLGRLAGKVVRIFEGGMGVQFTLSPGQREVVRERLEAALGGMPYMRLSEKRSSFRIRYNIETYAQVDGHEERIACIIKDMSRTGCLLQSETQPQIGLDLTLGTLRGRVVRHVTDGFAIEFLRLAAPGSVDHASQRHMA